MRHCCLSKKTDGNQGQMMTLIIKRLCKITYHIPWAYTNCITISNTKNTRISNYNLFMGNMGNICEKCYIQENRGKACYVKETICRGALRAGKEVCSFIKLEVTFCCQNIVTRRGITRERRRQQNCIEHRKGEWISLNL